MPKKTKTTEEHLKTIELLIAGLLINQDSKPDVKKLAKLMEVSDSTITQLYPQRKTKQPQPQSDQDTISE